MRNIAHLTYFTLIVIAIGYADFRNTQRANDLGGYTQYTAQRIINTVRGACNAPNV